MKKILISLFLLSAAGIISAGEIGYVDIERIFREYSGMNDLRSQLQILENNWTNEAESRKREWLTLQSELETEAVTLSEEEISRRKDAINGKRNEYESFVQSVWGENGLLKKKTEELTESPVAQINKTIMEVAEIKNVSLVLDVSSGVILFAEAGLDMTSEVLARLNAEYVTVADTTEPEKIKLAFLSVAALTADARASGIAQTASSLINSALSKIISVEMSKSEDVSQGMTQNGITAIESVSESQLSALASFLGVEYIVRGQITQTGEQFNLKLFLFSASLFREFLAVEENFERTENLEKAVENLVSEIATEL